MAGTTPAPAVKVVGANGQITLGKQSATVIPDNERWLHRSAAAADLQAAMAWSVSHAPADADLEGTLNRLGDDRR